MTKLTTRQKFKDAAVFTLAAIGILIFLWIDGRLN